jgi:microcin C transport system ATP-binding protein
MSLLEVRDLSVTFRVNRQEIKAVKNVSFSIERGETCALVGESGAGKSATALSIMQLHPKDRVEYPSGSVLFDGKDIMGVPEEVARSIRGNRISMIFQEPMTSLNPLHKVEKQISEGLMLHQGVARESTRERVIELLHLVGLPEAVERLNAYPHQLSGGQRQRVMIAMALANNPDLLIADEPTTALDVTIQAGILELLNKLKRELNMSLLLITHDLTIVRKMVDRVAVMKDGEIVEAGALKKVFETPTHKYTKYLLASELNEYAQKIGNEMDVIVDTRDLKVYFPIQKGVLRTTKGYVKAVNGVSFSIKKGQTVGLVGESGSGKTTLGLALLRLISSEGSIRYRGKEIQSLKSNALRPLRKEIQVIFQDPFGSLNPRFTIGQIIEEGLKVHRIGSSPKDRERLISDVLEEVEIDPSSRHRYPHEFSGGQRQRISIARALVLKPRFLVLDEPTSSIDMSVQTQVIDLLKELQKKYELAYLFISHDLRVVRAISHSIMVMKDGKIVEEGAPEDIYENPQNLYTMSLIKAAFDIESREDSQSN